MVSRRDELLSSLDSAFTQLRTSFTGPTGLVDARRQSTGAAGPSAMPTSSSSPRTGVNRAPEPSQGDDELPSYAESRRFPHSPPPPRGAHSRRQSSVSSPAPPTGSGPYHTFSFRSASGKVTLRLQAPAGRRAARNGQPAGDKIPVLVHNRDMELKGDVTLDLGDMGEPISEVRIKCKGVVKTLVLRARGGGSGGSRVPLVDENVFLQADRSLYQPAPGAPSDAKLAGTHTFRFSFTLPSTIPSFSTSSSTPNVPLPPSFALTSPVTRPPNGLMGMPFGDEGNSVTEWASVKYYLKLTIAKRGFFKLNERLFAPFVLLSSPAEAGAGFGNADTGRWEELLENGRRIPGPAEVPQQWLGRKVRQNVPPAGGIGFGSYRSKRRDAGWYEVIALLPTPPVYNRRLPLPYYLKIVSSDTAVTGDFPAASVEVQLIQRVTLNAAGSTGVHENAVGRGTIEPDGPDGGVVRGKAEWARKLKGEIKLTGGAVPNFACPNVSVEYYFVATIRPEAAAADQSMVVLPVRLVSCPKRAPSYAGGVPASPSLSSMAAEAAPAGSTPRPDMEVDLPPSYFEVQEMDRRQAA